MNLAPLYEYKMASATEKRYADQTLLPPALNTTNHSPEHEVHAATSTDNPSRQHHSHLLSTVHSTSNRPFAGGIQFAGRLGGNQSFVLDRSDPQNAPLLSRTPDAAPYMSVREQFSLRGFTEPELWKAALMEGTGTLLLTYLSVWTSVSPDVLPLPPDPRYGLFNNAAFIGPVVGATTNWLALTLFTYTFSPVTGAHLNPTISLATFAARLTSFPRMALYVAFQTAGGALAGLLVRASYGTRAFKAGGCYLFSSHVPVSNAFTIEFTSCLALLFLAFGVGLDPRQRAVFGPALAPVFVGAISCLLTLGTSFTRYGFGGAGLNPARCLGVMVGSRFGGWHWIHWVAPVCASVVHGFFYLVLPPWSFSGEETRAKGGGRGSSA